jgi:hypothetical protein
MANKSKAQPESKVIQGEKVDGLEQIEKARGLDKKNDLKKGDKVDSRDRQAEKLLDKADPKREATNLRVAARADYLKAHGETPGNEGDGGASSGSLKKVGEIVNLGKQYRGDVTCTSVHGQTHEKISAKIHLPVPHGEDSVFAAFKQYHPNAVRDEFEIDATNKADPGLRSRYE